MIQKIRQTVMDQLRKNATPRGLAAAATVGVMYGCFPVMGLTTLLAFVTGTIFRLNHPMIQLANYAMGVPQLILMPVFLRIGERLVGAVPIEFSLSKMTAEFSASPIGFFEHYGISVLHAILAWALVMPLIALMLFLIFEPIFRRLSAGLRALPPKL